MPLNDVWGERGVLGIIVVEDRPGGLRVGMALNFDFWAVKQGKVRTLTMQKAAGCLMSHPWRR